MPRAREDTLHMRIAIGLGNPGDKYRLTYHNMGFMVADAAAQKLGVKFRGKECLAHTAAVFSRGEKSLIACPQTYMNLSGESVKQLIAKYRADISDILVIYDDIDIEKGALRLRLSGSGGTHNGMRSIIASIGSTQFKRLRVGIGRPPNEHMDLAGYVLSSVPEAERQLIFDGVMRASGAVAEFLSGADFEQLMQKYNVSAQET